MSELTQYSVNFKKGVEKGEGEGEWRFGGEKRERVAEGKMRERWQEKKGAWWGVEGVDKADGRLIRQRAAKKESGKKWKG